jgi:hypothetical protein
MKIKSIAAVGAMGVGLGIASLVGGTGTASAEECGAPGSDAGPPFAGPIGTGKIICNIVSNGRSFAMSVDPGYNLGVLLNGTADNPNLGLLDQPTTFVDSIAGPGGFLDGPRAPGGPSPVDTGTDAP